MLLLQSLMSGWEKLFFAPASVITISVMRMLAGILIISETFQWFKNYGILIKPAGLFAFDIYKSSTAKSRFSLLAYLPANEASVNALLAIQLLGGILLFAGIVSQYAALICFVTMVSVHNRNPFVLDSGDTVRRFLCFFLVFAPFGTQLSLLHSREWLNPSSAGEPWALFLIRFFVANIYLKNVLFKLTGKWWRNGSATQKVFHARIWVRFSIPQFLDRKWFYQFTTYATLIIEILLCTLIWFDPFRPYVIILGIFLHAAIWIMMPIGLFQFTMICMLLSFVKDAEYLRFFTWLGVT